MRGAKRKAVIQSEDVIGETHSVCVMLLAPQVGLVLKQAIENMRRVPRRGVDDLLVWKHSGRPSFAHNVGGSTNCWASRH
jgi:hypothetical protein